MSQAAASLGADEPPKTGQKRDTLLYVRTDPPGAKVFFQGKELGTTNRLFQVEPGNGTLTIEWEGRKAGETEVTIRANAVTRVTLSLETQAEATGDRFIAHWPQGTVELLGVTQYPPTEHSRWWKPDGSSADLGPFLQRPMRWSPSPDKPAFAFLVREDLPADGSWPVWKTEPGGSWGATRVLDVHGAEVPHHGLLCVEFSSPTATANFRVGIDMGDWETVVAQPVDRLGTSQYNREGHEWTVTFIKAEATGRVVDDSTRVRLTSNEPYGEVRSRLVAVTSDGKEHPAWIGYIGENGAAFFDGLALSSIQEFRYQVRSFSWVDFKNISLESGQKTDVKVISSENCAKAEKDDPDTSR
jgi:hypothetical protein